MAEAQPIQATPENLPQQLASAIQERVENVAERVQDLETQRRDQFVRGQTRMRIDQRFPPQNAIRTRPLESAQVDPTMMNPQVRPEAEQLQAEREHKARMLQNRKAVKEQMKQYRDAPLLFQQPVTEIPPESQALTQRISRFREQYQAAAPGSPVRSKIENQVKGLVEKFGSEKGQKQLTDQINKKITQWIWRGASDGTVIEWEGITAWVVSILGVFVWAIRALVTIFRPQSPKWLRLAEFDLKDPATWAVDLPYGIVAVFALVAIGIVVMFLVIVFSVIGGYLGYLAYSLGLSFLL